MRERAQGARVGDRRAAFGLARCERHVSDRRAGSLSCQHGLGWNGNASPSPTLLMDMNEPTRASVGFRSERGPILIALMLTTGLVAIDSTILATAVPSIVQDLGGFAQFPWLFSIYLLAQAVSVPVYAKLVRHRRPQADHPDRHRAVPARLGALRLRLEHARADRVPRGAGPRRRRDPADVDHDRRRHLHRRRARQDAGLPRERVGDLVGRRPDARRRVLAVPVVALDLLRQRAAVHPGRVDADPRASTRASSAASTASTTRAPCSSPAA